MRSIILFLAALLLTSFAVAEDSSTNLVQHTSEPCVGGHCKPPPAYIIERHPLVNGWDDMPLDERHDQSIPASAAGFGITQSAAGSLSASNPFRPLQGPLLLLNTVFTTAEANSTLGKDILKAAKPGVSEEELELNEVRGKGRGGGGRLLGGATSLGSKSVSNPFRVLYGPLLLLNTFLTTAEANCTLGRNRPTAAKPRISDAAYLDYLNEVRAKAGCGGDGLAAVNASSKPTKEFLKSLKPRVSEEEELKEARETRGARLGAGAGAVGQAQVGGGDGMPSLGSRFEFVGKTLLGTLLFVIVTLIAF